MSVCCLTLHVQLHLLHSGRRMAGESAELDRQHEEANQTRESDVGTGDRINQALEALVRCTDERTGDVAVCAGGSRERAGWAAVFFVWKATRELWLECVTGYWHSSHAQRWKMCACATAVPVVSGERQCSHSDSV